MLFLRTLEFAGVIIVFALFVPVMKQLIKRMKNDRK